MVASSQEEQRSVSAMPQPSAALQPQGGRPPRHGNASGQGLAPESASLTAAKLLDQISHMASLEAQVRSRSCMQRPSPCIHAELAIMHVTIACMHVL
jgi:hypothetical protein